MTKRECFLKYISYKGSKGSISYSNMKGNKSMRGTHRRNKRKKNQLLGILACIAGLLALAGVIFFAINKVMKGNFFAKAGETEYVAYDFEEVLLDEYGAPTGGGLLAGEATRHRVNVIATPGGAGTVTESQYVTDGGSLTVEVKDEKDGYEFDGWYIDGARVSQDNSYNIVEIKSDMTVIAKFSVDTIDVTAIAMVYDNGVSYSGGGIVTGGGSLYKNDTGCVITAIANRLGGYVFDYFEVSGKDGKFLGSGGDTPMITVYAKSGPDDDATAFVDKDTVVTAHFKKVDWRVTASLVPGAGVLYFEDDSSYKAPVISACSTNLHTIKLRWSIPQTTVQVTGSDGKPVDKDRYAMDSLLVVQNNNVTFQMDLSGSSLEGGAILTEDQFPKEVDFDIYITLKPTLAQDQGTFSASTISVPNKGGVTTGGGSSTLSSTYNLKAVPNVGYKFDHWEWWESGVGKSVFKTSKNPELLVKPSGFVTYYAFFVPANYNITLASSDPSDAGTVLGLGNVMADAGGNASTTVTVRTTSGYELDSGTYVMGGNSYIVNFQKDPIIANQYTIQINNITDDVALNLKYKKSVTNKARVVIWDDSGADENKIKFDGDSDYSNDSATKDVEINSSTATNVKIWAKAVAGYRLKQWVSSNGSVITNFDYDPTELAYYVVVPVTGDTSFFAQFEKEAYTIEVAADPTTYGSVSLSPVYAGTETKDTQVPPGSTRTLIAKANADKHFLYWTTSTGTKLTGVQDGSKNALQLKNINWSEKYTAHFVDNSLEIGVDVSDPEAGTAQLNNKAPVSIYTAYNDIPYEETIYLKAEPKSGYRFVRWDIITYDGLKQESRVSYSEPSISLVYVVQDVDCVAVFEKGDYTIKVASAPVAGGKATANGMNDQAEVDEGAKVTLEATPNTGYTFDYWTDSAGNRYTDNPYTIDSVNGNDTFTAHFKSPQVRVTIKPSTDGSGTVQLDDNPAVSTKAVYSDILNGSTVTLRAVPNNGYKFVRWEAYSESSNKTTAYGDANTVITDIREDTTFTAVFSDSSYTVKVVSNPVNGGKTFVNDKFDSADFMPGESATLEAMPESGYRFDYWTDSAGNKYTQNPYTLTSVNGNETYTAHFVNGKVQITVNNMPEDASYLKVNGNKVSSGTTVEVESGENIVLTAEDVDSQKYKFERWESGSGKIYTTNPLNLVNVTQSETYTAVYNSTEKEKGITVLSSPASGGKATKTIDKNGNGAILKAVANPGYYFVSWSKNNVVFADTPEVMVFDLSDGVVYKASFAKDKNYDAKSDIVHEHFYRDKRLFTNPNYTVTRQKMEADAKMRIEAEKASQYADSTPGLKQYKAVSDAEEIFDDIELKEDKSVVMVDSELITTNGEIMPLTVVSDRSREETAADEFTQKKYGKRYTYEIVACKDVGIPEGFEDGIRTYIWKYQEIESKDNIYILYETADGKMDWVSCTVDAGDSLKFTIDSIGTGVRMTIVKVIIE